MRKGGEEEGLGEEAGLWKEGQMFPNRNISAEQSEKRQAEARLFAGTCAHRAAGQASLSLLCP